MRKMLSILSSLVILAPAATVVACGEKFGADLSKIGDWDWSKEEPYFNGYDSKWNLPMSQISADKQDLGKINIENRGNYLNLDSFNTSFKTTDEIKKQVATATPLNSKFLPNGNFVSEIRQIDKKELYDTKNKLVDWKYEEDLDAKYNTSRIPLQKREKVAQKWIDRQSSDALEMNMSTIIESTSKENTIIGKKRTYSRSFNNYQYNDILVSWAGAIDEGIVVPPGKNEVEKGHLNGTKVLGNVFLDGYHGLTKPLVQGFIEKDNNGNYLVVDVLIEMALKMGFDGWFWNNEPNGSQPNGTVLDYEISIEIMKQLQEKINNSSDPAVKELIIFGYRNFGTLELNPDKTPIDQEAQEIYKNTNYFLNDFYRFPYEMESFSDKNNLSHEEQLKIFNMYNTGAWVGGEIFYGKDRIGTRDFRELTQIPLDQDNNKYTNFEDFYNGFYRKTINGKQMGWQFDSENDGQAINSMALFAGHVPYDIASQEMDKENSTKSIDLDTYGMVVANNYDDVLYTGKNKSLSNNDESLAYYPNSDFDEELVGKSGGVGHVIQESTVLTDDLPYFKTNFSTGQGNQFRSEISSGEFKTIENYPWSNTNIADIQPTYKWRVRDKERNQIITKETDGKNKRNNISGYYDYYNPYKKGNSIALGGGYNTKGEILPSESWEKNSEYQWDIMGANYDQPKSRNIEVVVKINDNLTSQAINNADVNIIANDIKGNNLILSSSSYESLNDGWFKLKATVNDTLSNIGLSFKPNTEKFKINVGEITVTDSENNQQVEEQNGQVNLKSEFLLERNNEWSIRLNFENILDKSLYSYYEVYQKQDQNLIRLGESNADNYYLKELNTNYNEFYIKVFGENNSIKWVSFKI